VELSQAIQERRSVKKYLSDVTLGDEQLQELFEAVRLSPSSFNIQHCSFVVVRDQANKDRLMGQAYNQPQVGQASAAIIVVADPDQYRQAVDYWRASGVPQEVVDRYAKMIPGFYDNDPQKRRDEALRTAGMWAMTLMLKATDMGLQTGPMIGFDPEGVANAFHIQAPKFPAMLIVVGKQDPAATVHPRPYRRALSDLVKLESFDGSALADAAE
jgi:nitroreductase